MVIVDASEVKTLVEMVCHLRYAGEWALERRASPTGFLRGRLHFRVDQAGCSYS